MMQITTPMVEKKGTNPLTVLLTGGGIGVAVVLFLFVVSRVGIFSGMWGGGTAVISPDAVVITGEGMRFGVDELRVQVGETVTLHLQNNDLYAHSFDLDEFDVHAPMPANESRTITFTATRPGSYQFYCGIPGHVNGGMVGTIIVEP